MSSILPRPLRLLILAGSGDAALLTKRLAERPTLVTTTSFAGRVEHLKLPTLPPGCRVRVGGFGGVEGLIRYLTSEKIDALIDATHPFAAQMHQNAALACEYLHLPLLALTRPPWKQEGRRWHEVDDIPAAAALAPALGKRIFLTIGRQELEPFAVHADRWFLIRSIDKPGVPLPAQHQLLLERGPFSFDDEMRLMREHCIDLLVSKNSGGSATFAKIAAAHALDIPIVMVKRPARKIVPSVESVEEVLGWIGALPLA